MSPVMTPMAQKKGALGAGQTVQKAQRVKRKMQITLHLLVTCPGVVVGAMAACEQSGNASSSVFAFHTPHLPVLLGFWQKSAGRSCGDPPVLANQMQPLSKNTLHFFLNRSDF
jgi:hypothetical protein